MKAAKFLLHNALPVLAIGFALLSPEVRAQAQSLLSSNQVIITRVEPILPDGLLITGINFGKSSNDDKGEKGERNSNSTNPVVSLFHPGSKTIAVLTSRYTAGSSEIIATLPVGLTSRSPGTYRLMVSFGSGTAATDVFEFTIGAVGLTGAKGDKGDQGIQGIQGLKGDKGDQGIQGVKGDKGDTGAQGLKGDQGIQGIQGLKGDKGDQGIQGVQGVKGDKGDTGSQGFQGLQGFKGDKGDTGEKGEKGDKGDTGAVGPQGITGVTGLMALPIFQNKPAAIDGGLTVGQFWVQANSGQVYRLMDLRRDN